MQRVIIFMSCYHLQVLNLIVELVDLCPFSGQQWLLLLDDAVLDLQDGRLRLFGAVERLAPLRHAATQLLESGLQLQLACQNDGANVKTLHIEVSTYSWLNGIVLQNSFAQPMHQSVLDDARHSTCQNQASASTMPAQTSYYASHF